jgi:hypothetical protein
MSNLIHQALAAEPNRYASAGAIIATQEFLLAYLALAEVPGTWSVARYYVMSHALELSLKSALYSLGCNADGYGHQTEAMMKKDRALWASLQRFIPSKDARAAFNRTKDMTDHMIEWPDLVDHIDELELLCCMDLNPNIRYFSKRNKEPLMKAWPGTLPVNPRYLMIIAEIWKRISMPHTYVQSFWKAVRDSKIVVSPEMMEAMEAAFGPCPYAS